MAIDFLLKRRYAVAFFCGVSSSFIAMLFPLSLDMEKAWNGFLGGSAQGILFGVYCALPLYMMYFLVIRNINIVGVIFSFLSGATIVSPMTEFISGYPLEWAIMYNLVSLAVMAIGYHILYRFHFRTKQ